jgi:hypothetical protein
MDLHKVNVKFFAEKGSEIPLAAFIPVFHRWIQEDKLEGFLVDVTEYTHVHQGPGVLIIAQEANYSVDEAEGKRSFMVAQKRVPEKKAEEHLKTAFRRALQAASFLESEKEFVGKLKFSTGHFEVTINDRLVAPGGSASQAEIEKHLKPFLDNLYGAGSYQLTGEKDAKKLAGFGVKVNSNPEASALLAKLK